MIRVLEVLGKSAGGVARHVAAISGGLHEPGTLEIDVAGPPDLPIEIPRLAHHVTIPDGPIKGHRAVIAQIKAVLADSRYDLVHAHGLRAAIDCAAACRRTRIPLYMSMHNLVRSDITGGLKAKLYRWGEALAVRSSVRTFAPSEEIARHLRQTVKVDPGRIEVLYLGVGEPADEQRTRAEVRAEWGVPPGAQVVITVARLAPQKALHVLLKTVAEIEGVHLVVVGDGPLEEDLKALAASLSLEDRVAWMGFRDDVHDQLRASDVFCLTSLWEAVSLAVQEAVLLGVPVVATDVGGIPELIEHDVSGLLVTKGDVPSLVAALRKVLDDPIAAEARARVAREALRSRFSTERMLRSLRDAYLRSPSAL